MAISLDGGWDKSFKPFSIGWGIPGMGVDRRGDQLLHVVWCIATERWICAFERRFVSKFRGLSWMVKDIRACEVSGGGEQHHRAGRFEDFSELVQGGMSPQQEARAADEKR